MCLCILHSIKNEGNHKMTERQLKKIARQYAARLPDGLSYHAVKYDFEHHGWRFVLFNTENGDRLIAELSADLLEYAKEQGGFVYAGTTARYVGVAANLTGEDRVNAMVHEAGHIELGHKLDLEYDPVAEAESRRFVTYVRNYKPLFWRRHLKKIVVCACCLAALLVGGGIYYAAHSLQQPNDVTPVSAPAPSTEEDPLVYYTSSGEKYHKKGCPIIKYKTNVTETRLSEAVRRLEPCSFCFPDEQDSQKR